MDEWLARLLTVTYPVVIICGTGLFGFWLKLRHERRLAADKRDEFAELEARIADLREAQAGQLAEIQERLDFAERMITQLRLAPPEAADTPTPV